MNPNGITHDCAGSAPAPATSDDWRSWIEGLPDMVWTCTADGRCDYVNRRWIEFTGRPFAEHMGEGWLASVHPDDHAATYAAWETAVARGEAFCADFRVRKHNGDYRWFMTCGAPLLDANGRVQRWLGNCTEIERLKRIEAELRETERRSRMFRDEAEHRAAEIQAVFDSLQSPVFVFDATGKLVRTNRATARLFGLESLPAGEESFDSLIGRLRLRHPGGRRVRLAELPSSRALRGETVTGKSLELTAAEGRQLTILATATPLKVNGRVIGAVASWHDVTERETLLRQVSELAATLEQRVAERTAELTESYREMEGFTYAVAHDLRAPLRHVAGFARVLHRRVGDKLGPDELRFLDNIEEAIDRMGRLIDDLLRFSWASRIALRPGSVCLNTILDLALSAVLPEAQDREIEWRIQRLPVVQGDATLLQQVFVNLLSNALKFTRQNPHPVIEVGFEALAGWARVFVRDNGVGFDPRYTDKLFAIFERLHDPAQFEGTGIGLALVQRIIQRHGGHVTAEGQIGRGATFSFTLPVPAEPAMAQAA